MVWAVTAVVAVSTAAGAYQQNKASQMQRKQANIENARARRQALAEARAARASSENAGALSGAFGGSAASAAASGITSKTAGAIGNQQQAVSMNNAINTRISNAQIYGDVASLAQMIGPGIVDKMKNKDTGVTDKLKKA
jgi:hypothetical protein